LNDNGGDVDGGESEYWRDMWNGFWDFDLGQQSNQDDTQDDNIVDVASPPIQNVDDNEIGDTEDVGRQEKLSQAGMSSGPEWDDFWNWFKKARMGEVPNTLKGDIQSAPATSTITREIGGDGFQDQRTSATYNALTEPTTCIRPTKTYTVYPDWFSGVASRRLRPRQSSAKHIN
jgi:hypothetical protein